MKTKKNFMINTSLIFLLLTACSSLKPAPTSTPTAIPTPTTQVLPATGTQYHFVTDKLMLPITMAQAQAFGLNIDGDSQERPDNLFGTLLSLLTSAAPSLELQSNLDQIINSGQLVSLHLVQADALSNDSNVSWSIFLGQKAQSTPKFDGSDTFMLNNSVPASLPITGTLTNGHFIGGPGKARIQMSLMGQAIDIALIGVRIEADLSAQGCANAKLGGGVTGEEFRGNLLPAIADGLNRVIKDDPALASTLLLAFDSDKNGTITTQELENNPFLMFALSPDLDLLDASGEFNPGQDNVKDSYSVGLGFTCVPATFAGPGQ